MKRLLLVFAVTAGSLFAAQPEKLYPIVGTGQTKCYDTHREIAPPKAGQAFYGQDAQHPGTAPSYKLGADGLTVLDQVTGLTWQRSPDTNGNHKADHGDKLTLSQAEALPAKLNATRFGGFTDWRLPTIKELYSLIQFSGTDPSGPDASSMKLTPFIDMRFFDFVYGDEKYERIIDSQWATSTTYVFKGGRDGEKMFGVNFADGRIKGYGLRMRGNDEKTFFVLCVRGNPQYGKNDFHDNDDGTISDRATGLVWSKADSGKGMNWQAALAWVQAKNAERYLGHNDWRLPNAKELQSILDYSRCPDTTNSAAIDPVFNCTAIKNEGGQTDYPFYWTGTTHASLQGGSNGVYVAFGRASGWPSGMMGRGGGPAGMAGPGGAGGPGGNRAGAGGGSGGNASGGIFADVHGAGAQRSDPKDGDVANFPHGRGPQGDVVRINNFVRLVRGG